MIGQGGWRKPASSTDPVTIRFQARMVAANTPALVIFITIKMSTGVVIMRLRTVLFWIMVATCTFILPARGEENTVPETFREYVDKGEYRTFYNQSSDLPIGIAFDALLSNLAILEDRKGRSKSLSQVYSSTTLRGERAEDLLVKLLRTKTEVSETVKRELFSTLCTGEVPKVHGDAGFSALESIDDQRPLLYESAYNDLRRELEQDQQDALAAWLAEVAKNTSHMDLDYRKIYARKGKNVDTTISGICLGGQSSE